MANTNYVVATINWAGINKFQKRVGWTHLALLPPRACAVLRSTLFRWPAARSITRISLLRIKPRFAGAWLGQRINGISIASGDVGLA